MSTLNFFSRVSVSLVLQAESSECGLACLTMLANYHGNHIELADLRTSFDCSADGSNLKTIIEQAGSLGLTSRAVKLDLEDLKDLNLPAIIHWDFNHFVVLTKVKPKHIVIADPACGIRQLSLADTSDHFTGVALELYPNNAFEQIKAEKPLKLSHFMKNTAGIKSTLAMLLGLSLVLQVFVIASPFYMQTVIDLVVVKHDRDLLNILALGFALLLIMSIATQFIREKITLHFSSRLNLVISQNVFQHLIHLPISYFQKRHMGDIVSRFSSVQQIREIITSGIVTALIDGLMAIVTLIVMLMYSVKLTLIVLAVVALYSLIRWLTYSPLHRLSRESIQSYALENAFFMQSVRAIKTIKLSGKESDSNNRWGSHLINAMNKDITIANWSINLSSVNKALFGIENLVVIFFAALLVLNNAITVGMLFAFMSYKGKFVGAADSLIDKIIEFKMLDIHLARLADILKTTPEQPSNLQSLQKNKIATLSDLTNTLPSAQIKDLCFAYSSAQAPIFSNINFDIKTGSSVAIIGKSGSGKSTLLMCLLGLLQPTQGSIRYRGLVMNANSRKQHKIGAVLQEDQLLNGSILQNISDFDVQVDLAQVVLAAQMASLHEDIMRMTMQYQSLIGDMGDSLSGGQRQRLILARALYKKPDILMLDEASSHLDVATEMQINQHLKRLSITKIIIAHRRESIRQADKIMELSGGALIDVTDTFFNQQISS